MGEIFKRDLKDYSTGLNPVSEYVSQAASALSKNNGKSIKENKVRVKKLIKLCKPVNPIVKYHNQDDDGNKTIEEVPLTDYIKDTIDDGQIFAPSMTTYIHPSKKRSLHAEFLEENISARKKDKHNAFKYKQLGDEDKYQYYNTLQKVRKIFNNSLSGAYASKSTTLYNPSAHYTLTSTTRSVTSIGNAITESMLSGNKHFKDSATVFNYISSVISKIDLDNVSKVIEKYGLKIPTVESVYESIMKSASRYWENKVVEKKIFSYLSNLTDVELASVMYVNDFYNLRVCNNELIRDMISKLSERVTTGSTDNLKDIDTASEGVVNLVHHVCSEDIKGKTINYKELVGTEVLMVLGSTTKHIMDTLRYYEDLIKAFFVTDILPPTIAYIKDMLRDNIVLSDTDSTCGSYDEWVKWYFGSIQYGPKPTAVSAAVMTINTQVMDHYLKVFTANLNIDKKDVELIKMKNEFYWDVFVPTNVSKHYFGNIMIQEGNVYEKPDLELKGVHLIASNTSKRVRDVGYKMIDDINLDITSGRGIDLYKYVKIAADTEREIIKSINSGSTDIFKVDQIKEESAYKLGRDKSPYLHYLLWNEVFADKYGSSGEPTYMVINISTKLSSKRKMNEYLDSIEDADIREKLTKFLQVRGKESLGTFRIPLLIASENGLPKEIHDAIDYYRVITTSMNIIYLVLEAFSFFRKPDMLISEMGY